MINNILRYYIFDIDDNIVHMNTKINMEKFDGVSWIPVEVNTSDFITFREDPLYRYSFKDGKEDLSKSFENFKDDGFMEDFIEAIENKRYGKSFNALKECLINGNLFVLNSARAAGTQTLKRSIKYFIEIVLDREEKKIMLQNLIIYASLFEIDYKDKNELLDIYLDSCEFVGVSSSEFIMKYKNKNTEESKQIVTESFLNRCLKFSKKLGCKISLGFSDDDKKNSDAIAKLFKKLKQKHPSVEFTIFETSKNYKKIKI